MNAIARFWHGLWHWEVKTGDIDIPEDWESHDVREFSYPPVSWAKYLITRDHGRRLLLFRKLVFISDDGVPSYLPYVWIEYIHDDPRLLVILHIGMRRKLAFRIPLSVRGILRHGPLSWRYKVHASEDED